MAERELAILIRARDLASKTIRAVNKELGKTGSIAAKGAKTAAGNIAKLGTVAGGVVVAGIGASVKAAADFESQLNTINTVAGKTPDELAAIGKSIRQIARDTGTPLEELTAGFYDLVSAGVAADQAQRVLASSNRLAIGGLASAAEGVDLITTAMNSYGVAADQQGAASERFADVFAKAIERGKVNASELAASFSKVGPLAASMGVGIEEVAAGYAQLTAKGVPAAEAATQMSSAMVSLIRKTGPLEKLEKQTRRNYAAIAERDGLAAAFEQLRKDAAKANVPLIELVGRQEAMQFALNTTGDSLDAYNANLAAMNDAQGTAALQMGERQKGLNFQLARLKALALDAGITLGSKLLPKLTPLAERAVAFLQANEPAIERFGDEIAGAFDKAVQFAEKIPWGAVGSGLKTAAAWAGKLMDLFASMPPQAQATIVALAGLNKLTGGAVGGIVSELGKGLIKGVLGMNAGVVNINAGVVNGAGRGVPGVGGRGGGAGALATGARLILPVGGAILAGELLAEGLRSPETKRRVALATGDAFADVNRSRGFLQLDQNGRPVPVGPRAQTATATPRTAGNTDPQASSARLIPGIGDTRGELTGIRNAIRDEGNRAARAVQIAERSGATVATKIDTTRSELVGIRQSQERRLADLAAVSRAAAGSTRSELAGIRSGVAAIPSAIRNIQFRPVFQPIINVPAPRVSITQIDRGVRRYYQYGNGGPVQSRVIY